MADIKKMDELYKKIEKELTGLEGDEFEKKKTEIMEEFFSAHSPEHQEGLRKKQKEFDAKTPQEKLAYLQMFIPEQKKSLEKNILELSNALIRMNISLKDLMNIDYDKLKEELKKADPEKLQQIFNLLEKLKKK